MRVSDLMVETTLGAAMAVLHDDEGVVAFVFLDEDDMRHTIPVEELDEDWENLLREALG